MKPVLLLSILLFGTHPLDAQPNLGVELSYARFVTSNAGKLLGVNEWLISNERDLETGSIGMGVFYKMTERHLVRIGLTAHKQGQRFDVHIYEHGTLRNVIPNIESRVYLVQISPGYVHRLCFGNWIVPTGIGLNINKRIREVEYRFTIVKEYNFDVRLSAGLQYRVIDNLIIGLNAVYNHGLGEHQYDLFESGTNKPRQLGLELSLIGEVMKADLQ